MKKNSMLLAFVLMIITGSSQAQGTSVCDCKMENGKNVLVVTGSVTLTKQTVLDGKVAKYTYTPGVQIYNKSSCTMKVLGFTISNTAQNPNITILPGGPEQGITKPIVSSRLATIINEGTNKIIKATVRYTLNGKLCNQVVELLYYDDTVIK